MASPMVGIIMGSQSDWSTMKEAANILAEFDIAYETKIVSAHRTPNRLWDYGNITQLNFAPTDAGKQRHGSWWRWDEQKPSDRLDPGFERGVGAAAEGAWQKGRGCRWEGRGGR